MLCSEPLCFVEDQVIENSHDITMHGQYIFSMYFHNPFPKGLNVSLFYNSTMG